MYGRGWVGEWVVVSTCSSCLQKLNCTTAGVVSLQQSNPESGSTAVKEI